ncbi:MAG TPA: DNA methyltransferase [Candidatus Acidoferrum sp.]|jgi:tRNA G10  N-methylase Trm11|nr:DNA methyltransferase [Candidatus Acidoferrum sp.]
MPNPQQATYVFVPGKNWKLSLAELTTFFEARNLRFQVSDLSKSFFTVETEDTLNPSIIDDLGGTIKIGKALLLISLENVKEAFLHKNKRAQAQIKTDLTEKLPTTAFFQNPFKRLVFGVSLYFDDRHFLRSSKEMHRFIGNCFKQKLEPEGVKAKFMGFPKDRRLPQLTHVEVLKKRLIEESAEILFCISNKQAFIAKTIAVHNPFEFQKRDINRPVQRKIFSIPPRLAKIMVNLSLCSQGKTLLDPFCGVGTILQEAMLTKAQVIGVDINPWCVEAAHANLEWLKNQYGLNEASYRILSGDARHLSDQIPKETVDCIVTEPDLGPALRHVPTEPYAHKIINKMEPLFHEFLLQAQVMLRNSGRLVLVTPYIRTRRGTFVSMNIQDHATSVGFERVYPFEKTLFLDNSSFIADLQRTSSFVDMKKEHKIGREIHIFQK